MYVLPPIRKGVYMNMSLYHVIHPITLGMLPGFCTVRVYVNFIYLTVYMDLSYTNPRCSSTIPGTARLHTMFNLAYAVDTPFLGCNLYSELIAYKNYNE